MPVSALPMLLPTGIDQTSGGGATLLLTESMTQLVALAESMTQAVTLVESMTQVVALSLSAPEGVSILAGGGNVAGNQYEIGQVVRVTATFTLNSATTDPGSVTFEIRNPNGAQTNYTTSTGVVKASTGVYYLDVSPTSAGTWGYRAVGTSPVTSAHEDSFSVRATSFV